MRASLDPATSEAPALGMLELADVSTGFATADRVSKQAVVELLLCEPVTPGKFLVLFAGAVEAVVASLRAGKEALGAGALIDDLYLPAPHPTLLEAVRGTREVAIDAAGVVETRTVSAALRAADAGVKVADVELVCFRAAMRLGGRAFFVLTGAVSPVQAAVSEALRVAGAQGHSHVVLPRPHEALVRYLR